MRRVVSSIAASASRTKAGSRSNTRRAALAWSVTALSAWPTESCSSRASRLRTASSAARCSAAASRSAGVGPSSRGAQRASSAPQPAAQQTSASRLARPTGAASSTVQPSKTGIPRRESRSAAKNGSAIRATANGGSASVIPLMTPPRPMWSVNHPAVRTRAARDPAGPSARAAGSTPHSALAAATDSGRAIGNSAETAAIGNAQAKAASWSGRLPYTFAPPVTAPTITAPSRKYGINAAPPSTRWTQRSRAVRPSSRVGMIIRTA